MAAVTVRESQIFAPFRAVGYVSNHIPINVETRGSEQFVTSVVGKSYHVYNCKKLNLLFVGESTEEPISAITCSNHSTIVAAGNLVGIYKRGRKVLTYRQHNANVFLLLVLGDYVVSIDEENSMHIWSYLTLETHLAFSLDSNTFQITACAHPSTYLNKILVGSKQGILQLWNIRTHKLIHEFEGWKEPVVALEQSPAVDVIGVGLQSGRVILMNIKLDKILMSFYQEFGLITSISFRTDGTHVMATGSTEGHVSFWSLEKKQLLYIQRTAHSGSVTGMKFLQKQPLFITSGPDNSLKIWIFDNPDGSCRLLKSRCGHSGPPTQSLFYGSYGNVLLTAGIDRTLRYTSIMRGEQCHEFSQGSLLKKSKTSGIEVEALRLPPITCIASSTAREKDWDNLVTCHLGYFGAVTWNVMKQGIGKYKLGTENSNGKSAVVADVSSCGNFTVVGYSNGNLQKFNLQSGLERGALGKKGGHKSSIRGVSIDNANMTVVSTSADKTIKFWNFKDQKLNHTIYCSCPIAKSKLHRESALLAVCFEDFSISIYDIDTRNLVRQFHGHSSVITDISWSSDARWLISSSMDGSIKTWDVPSARLVDCFLVEYPAMSVSYSPTGEFLATTHQDNVGIYLWSNKVTYSGIYPTPLPNDYQPIAISLPTTQIEIEDTIIEDSEDHEMEEGSQDEYQSPDQIESPLITLSMLPESKWKTLINLDLIKERNKPKQPPKKPKAAPFFLPTVSGLETTFDLSKSKDDDDDEEKSNSKMISLNNLGMDTPFQKMLLQSKTTDRVIEILDTLKKMSPSEIDVELRILGPDAGGSVELLCCLIKLFVVMLHTGRDYDMIHAYISLFVKHHGDLIYKEQLLRDEVQILLDTLQNTWSTCDGLINQSVCLVKYFKSATV